MLYSCTPSVEGLVCNLFGSVHYTCRRLIDKNRCMCVRVDVVGQAATWLYVPQNIESKLYSNSVTSTFCGSLVSYGSWRLIRVVLLLMSINNWSQKTVTNTNQSQWVVSIISVYFPLYFWLTFLNTSSFL